MTALILKFTLAPAFVVCASLVARRYGPQIGGLAAALPVVAGPILFILALERGRTFAAHAAAGTCLGLVSLTAFVVVYGTLASRVNWALSLAIGWLAFIVSTAILSPLPLNPILVLLLAWSAFAGAFALVPHGERRQAHAGRLPPVWDLPLRGLSVLALVVLLTTVAGALGPRLSGLLTPFPIVTSILAAFTHVQHGEHETLRLLRGFLTGFFAFALFCFTLSLTLGSLGTGTAFALASAVALVAQGAALFLQPRSWPLTEAIE
jgi:uncharacterized membrane protein (GlpM family)